MQKSWLFHYLVTAQLSNWWPVGYMWLPLELPCAGGRPTMKPHTASTAHAVVDKGDSGGLYTATGSGCTVQGMLPAACLMAGACTLSVLPAWHGGGGVGRRSRLFPTSHSIWPMWFVAWGLHTVAGCDLWLHWSWTTLAYYINPEEMLRLEKFILISSSLCFNSSEKKDARANLTVVWVRSLAKPK